MSRQLRLSLSRGPHGPSESKKRQLSSQKTLDKPPAKRSKRPGEVYLDTYKAPPGITNPANNCYCNAVIQCLFNNAHILSQLKKVFSRHPDHCSQQCCSSGQLCAIKALKRMLEDYTVKWNSHTASTPSISPYPILSALNDLSSIFARGQQGDSHELYVQLVSTIKKEVAWKGNLDFDVHVEETTTVECSKCLTSSTSLPIKSVCIELFVQNGRSVHVQDLFSEYFEQEEVTAKCTLCNEEVVKLKRVSISNSNLPEILCIHVSCPSNRNGKPAQIQVQNSLLKIPGNKDGVYQLTGVIVHRQLFRRLGHYAAFVRSLQDPSKWFYTNDAQVTPVSIATVLLQSPAMLFYQKVHNVVECGSVLSLHACKRLRGVHYLNDEIMDSYMLLISTEASKINKKVSSFSSHFLAKLIKNGPSSVLSWYKKVDFHQQDLLLFVINDCGNHWTLLVVDMTSTTVEYFDSMHFDKPEYWEKIRCFLNDRTKGTINWDEWTYVFREDTPEQRNGIDCGVFACQYALYRVRGDSFSFEQEHMGLLRKVMLEELLSGNLISLKDRQQLISQHNCYNKLYDHDIFIEPALARSLHLRDIQSMPKDTETQQSEVELVCRGQDLLQGRKIKIPNVYSNENSLLNFKGKLASIAEFPSVQGHIKASSFDHTRKPLLSLSLNRLRLSSDKTMPQVNSTSKEQQQSSHPPFREKEQQQPSPSPLNIVQDMEHQTSSTSPLSISQEINQQESGLASLPPPSVDAKEQKQPSLSPLNSVRLQDMEHRKSSTSSFSISQAMSQQPPSLPPFRIQAKEQQQPSSSLETRQSEVELGQDLLQRRKIKTPNVYSSENSLLNSKENVVEFPLVQGHIKASTLKFDHTRKPLLSLSLNRSRSSSDKTMVQVNSTLKERQQSSHPPFRQAKEQQQPSPSPLNIVQDMEHQTSSTSSLSISQDINQQEPLASLPPPSVDAKEQQQPSLSPLNSVRLQDMEQGKPSTSSFSISQDMSQQPPSLPPFRIRAKEQQQQSLSPLNVRLQDMEQQKLNTSSHSISSDMNQLQSSCSPLSIAQSLSLSKSQARKEPSDLSIHLGISQVQTNEKRQLTMSTSQEICTPDQQSNCSLSIGSLSIKLQPSTTFEFDSISSSPPSSPISPSAPPFSPITTEEHGNNCPTCVPINKVTSHSQLPQPIYSLLPPNFTYTFKTFIPLNNHHEAFNTNFYINIKTEDEAKEWISKFEQKTNTTYRITKGTKTLGKKILYKTVRHCQHKRKKSNKLPKKDRANDINQRDKKTDCCATLTLRVHNRSKSSSKLQVTHPCEVNLLWDHNHSIHSAHALSFKPISDDTKQKFYDYFDQGYSPSTARHHHTMLLSIQYEGDDKGLEQAHADRSVNPLPKDIDYLFAKWRLERHGKVNGESMFEILEEKVQAYNKEYGDEGGRAHVQRYVKEHEKASTWLSDGSQPLVLAICTPVMARAHQMLRQSGELVYIDATSSLDRYNCPTFMISTCTPAGGIPLGVVITSGEDEATISEALTFLKSVFPTEAFYSRGSKGPEMCITDDSTAERAAIHNTWPETKLYLCIFHYLQSWWTWLWDGKQGIAKEDRPVLINLIKKMVFSKSQEDLEERYKSFIECDHPDSYTQKYPNLLKHLQIFWERRSEWALSFRIEMIFRNNHTNNYAEAAIRVLKEMVFGRMKAYNLIQMFNFITDTMEKYYQNRLLDMAHSRYRPGISLRFRDICKLTTTIVRIEQFSESIYCVSEEIKGELLEFFVDMEVGTCSCIKGLTGCECKHQAAIAKERKINSVNIPPFFSKAARRTFAILAVGKNKAMHLDFYANLRDDSQSPSSNNNFNLDDYHEQSYSSTEGSTSSKAEDAIMQRQTSAPEEESELSDHMQAYKVKLDTITGDMLMRCQSGDCNFISGLNRFIREYGKMKTSIRPTPAIAHALHMFGKDDRNSWSQGRRRYGKYIKVNSTGTRRRRKGLSKGSRQAPQGRPPIWKQSKYSMPNRKAKKPKRPHNLSENILLNRKN